MTAAERQLEQEMLDQPVCSLQYMLGRLSQKYGFLPQLAVSGNFDEQTLEAVMLFQRELFPPVNGVVNQDVWNAIRNEWIGFELEHAPPRALRGFPSSASAGLGDQGSYLLLPQAMFQSLSQILEGVAGGVAGRTARRGLRRKRPVAPEKGRAGRDRRNE